MIGTIDNSCRTINKWIPFDICYRLGDGDRLQEWAILKRLAANAGHWAGDGDRLQGWATIKRTVANARYGVEDGDGLQGWAISVFASILLSIIYILNGRKVIAWILWRVRNGKI